MKMKTTKATGYVRPHCICIACGTDMGVAMFDCLTGICVDCSPEYARLHPNMKTRTNAELGLTPEILLELGEIDHAEFVIMKTCENGSSEQ